MGSETPIYYQAKDVVVSSGLHWNITAHAFLLLAASKKFVPLKFRVNRDKYFGRMSWFRRRHIKSHRKLPSTTPSYNIDGTLFDNFIDENEKKLWDLIQPFLPKIPRSHYLPSSLSKTVAYTNHTVILEALEKWGIDVMQKLLPRHVEIIEMIDEELIQNIISKYGTTDLGTEYWVLNSERLAELRKVIYEFKHSPSNAKYIAFLIP
ncbi:hypothetical protein Taro_055743 [Colocasia esculenta]|uniref:Alpha-1,4 glucan phosphorylase n=1 Tax=Colocasia esculenta TaxID=4460 RepID=A0A843XV75_COLES|nr:hypothetical protein [Colocasia esculenta]